MTGDQWRIVKAIAADALDLPQHERAAFVDARCADESLRHEVLSLLEAAAQATDLYETPIVTADRLQALLAEAENAAGSFVGRRVRSS